MYLKRIEMNGFKSFNTKKEIILKRGITGIVGPNGSGKSNVADAIRWVLGEQSSKNLRGEKMEDVIFDGTQELARKGYCEVLLEFDNSDKKISCDFEEITVKRKMYRSGESEYSINGSLCRLKDIVEMFRDTGIGKEGYSIIGQGKIDEILNSKPTARRRVFEEAAGIMKFRAKKEEAERNLAKTRDNLVRLQDIISELETQIGPLKEQMIQAKEYNTLRERLKFLEVNLYLYNNDKSAERIEKLNAQLSENEEEQKDVAERSLELAQKSGEIKARIAKLQEEIDEHNKIIAGYGTRQERLRGELNVITEKESNIREKISEYTNNIEENIKIFQNGEEKIAELNAQIESLNLLIDESAESIAALKEKFGEIQALSGDVSQRYEEKRVYCEELRREVEKLNLSAVQTETKLSMLKEKNSGFLQQYKENELRAQQLREEKTALDENLDEIKAKNTRDAAKLNEISAKLKEVNAKYEQSKQKQEELRAVIGSSKSKLDLLSNMKDGYEGYGASVKSLFGGAKNNKFIKDKIIGTFADVIDVPKKYETAIETLLGNTLQNIVVKTESDAKDIIDFLRKNNLGRITFLPLDALKVKYLQQDEKNCFDSSVCGIASELVECDSSVRKAVDFLLARTVVIDELENAMKVMRKSDYTFRSVTLKGDIMRPGGTMTGGSADKKQHGILSRNRMIAELSQEISENKKLAKEALKEGQGIKEDLDKLVREREILLVELRKNDVESAKITEQIVSTVSLLKDFENKLEADKEQSVSMSDEIFECENELKTINSSKQENESVLESENGELLELEKTLAAHNENITKNRQELSDKELEQSKNTSKKQMLVSEVTRVRETVFNVKTQNESMQNTIESLENEQKNVLAPSKKKIHEELDNITVSIKNAGISARERFEERENLEQAQKLNEAAAKECYARKDELISLKYKISAAIEKTMLARENLEAKIWEEYGLTYANAKALEGEFSYMSANREMEEIRSRIREMGSVNPKAIEDYARVHERLNNLLVQKDDLIKAGEDIEVVIKSLMSDMKVNFKDKFNLINDNFKVIFKKLFGGGRAELVLLDDGDVMDCGIDIIAEPPGKKMRNLAPLSGGEKALCAISLIFAMLAINPSPLCLLDEIDAPLDEANVIGFSQYLRELARDLQFLVITHRKPTMAACDTLYGITMQKKGVSQILSVNLNQE